MRLGRPDRKVTAVQGLGDLQSLATTHLKMYFEYVARLPDDSAEKRDAVTNGSTCASEFTFEI